MRSALLLLLLVLPAQALSDFSSVQFLANLVEPTTTSSTLTDGLQVYYRLEEASGTRDDVQEAMDLSDINTVTQAAGKLGNAASYDVANIERLDGGTGSPVNFSGNQDFTLAAWVYVSSTASDRVIASKDSSAGFRGYSMHYSNSPDRFRFIVSNDGTATTALDADNLGAVSTGTWYYVVAWHDADADTINIQVDDGTADSTAHSTGVNNPSGIKFTVGGIHNAGNYHGRIDEVGVWNRVLTSAERTELYNSGTGEDPTD